MVVANEPGPGPTPNNSGLAEARLRSLARACSGFELDHVDASIGAGSAGNRGFYFSGDDPRAVGRALRWAESRHLAAIDLLADSGAGRLARRATLVAGNNHEPTIIVRRVHGAAASRAEPVPAEPPPELPASHWALAGVITEAGALAIDDHGVLIAEVAGLEVGRVVDSDDGARIEVGVGQADRELNQLVHRELDPGTGLRRVIAAVADYRTGHRHHPLTRVARERWLRSMLLDEPALVGASGLEPLVPLRPRHGLRTAEPAAAAGLTTAGLPVVVVTMVGIDPDLVPEAADYRDRWNPGAELLLVMPERDLALSTSLVSRLDRARIMALDGPWVS